MLITLEGIEGAGKSSQIGAIVEYLEHRGHAVVVTREPGGTEVGRKIRAILLKPSHRQMAPMTELFLYEADRAEHVQKVIAPALSEGKTVLCDRFYDATVVYQGYARGLDLGMIHQIHRFILADLRPDLTILLDLPPEIGLARAWAQIDNGFRTGDESRFEKEALEFHHKIRSGYLDLARCEPQRFRIVDASRDENTVRKEIIDCVKAAVGR